MTKKLTGLVMVLVILIPLMLMGCGIAHAILGDSNRHVVKNNVPPPSVDWTYVWIGGGAVIGIGIGVALAIILPGDDHVPYGVIGGCAAALILCLVIGTIKAILTWLLVGGCIIGVLWLVYRLYGRARIERLIKETT